jgi:hypothetical protein
MDVTCESKSDINPLDRDDEKSENEEYEVLRVKRERKMVKRLSLSGKKQKKSQRQKGKSLLEARKGGKDQGNPWETTPSKKTKNKDPS